MQVNQWTGKDGGTQQGYQVVADSVISARTARPGGKRGASARTNEVNEGHTTQPAPGWEIYNTPDYFDQRQPFDDEAQF